MTIVNGYCTLADFKAYKDIGNANVSDDTVIEDIIEKISQTFDDITGRTFYAASATKYFDTPSNSYLYLGNEDLLTITTITNGGGGVISAADYKLLPLNVSPKWQIKLINGKVWETDSSGYPDGAISINGTWGYTSTTPDEIKMACVSESVSEYLRRFGENRNTSATITSAGIVLSPSGFEKTTYDILIGYRRHV